MTPGTSSGFTYSDSKYGKATLGADLLFGFRKPITIDRSKLSDPSCAATLTNFPILYKRDRPGSQEHGKWWQGHLFNGR